MSPVLTSSDRDRADQKETTDSVRLSPPPRQYPCCGPHPDKDDELKHCGQAAGRSCPETDIDDSNHQRKYGDVEQHELK